MEKPIDVVAAELFILGFVKSWPFCQLTAALVQHTGKYCSDFQFLPDSNFWMGKAPVRGFVAQNYPKLAEFLDRATPAQQVAAARQVVRLRWNGSRPSGSMTGAEYKEVRADKKKADASTASYRMSRASFREHGKSNWNQCK